MKIEYVITPELRVRLKEPFGSLIQGTVEETMTKLEMLVEKEKPPMIISVGDVVSKTLHQYKLHPQLTVIDNISLRDQKIPPLEAHGEESVNVKNPQGTITEESTLAIQRALSRGVHTHIIVEGEEDLLTLTAVLNAPERSFVIYGQPHLGVVVIKVTGQKKCEVQEFLNAMKVSKS